MKKLLAFTVAAALASFSAAALADTVTLMVTKHGDSMAKLVSNPGKPGDECTVPVKFDSGASWDTMKDSYDVSPENAAKLKAGEEYILAESDGGITYRPTHHHMMKK
jgi:hypothetical protein